MDKKMFRSILLIITYAVLLVLLLLKIDVLIGHIGNFFSVMKPFFIGFVIAFVLNRPCGWFKRGYGKLLKGKAEGLALPLAVLSSYLAFLLVMVALVAFVVPQIAESMQTFAGNLEGGIQHLTYWVNQLLAKLDLENINIPDVTANLGETLRKVFDTLADAMGGMMGQVVAITSSIISVVVTLVLALVFSVYMLAGKDTLLAQCRSVLRTYVPARISERIIRVMGQAADIFTKYVQGQIVEACILGCLCCAGMVILRLDYAPMISVVIGVSALIPVAGAYIGAILGALMLLMVSPLKAVVFLIFLVCLQQIEGNVIYPRVVGTSLGLPGIWVLTAVTVGGGMFGLPGILLSVPTVSLIYSLVRQDVRRRRAERGQEASLPVEKGPENDAAE